MKIIILILLQFFVYCSAFGQDNLNVMPNFEWQTGQIVVSRHSYPYSLFIQLATLSNVEHVGFVSVEADGVYVFEFWGTKFRKTKMSVFLNRIDKQAGDALVAIAKIKDYDQLSEAQRKSFYDYLEDAVLTQNTSKYIPSCAHFLADGLRKIGINVGYSNNIPQVENVLILDILANKLGVNINLIKHLLTPRDFMHAEQIERIQDFEPLVIDRESLISRWRETINWRFFERLLDSKTNKNIKNFLDFRNQNLENICEQYLVIY